MHMFDREIIPENREPVNKNLCKVMMMADIFARRAPMCDLEREGVGNHRAVAAIGPVKGDAVFVPAAF